MMSPGLAYWQAAIGGRTVIDPQAAALMIAQPRFAEACRTSLRLSVERQSRDPLMSRVTKDISRLFYGYLVIYLDARGAITLTAIQDLCREIGLASAGRAQAILFHLKAIGYLKIDPENTNRRSRHYVPSPEMKAALREVMADELRAFSLIEPEAGRAADRMIEPEFYRAFMHRLGEGIVSGFKTRPLRPITHFAERNAGLIILWDVLLSAKDDDVYPPRGLLKMSVTEMAQKYSVSRSHVFRLFRDAEKLGLLTRNADEQTGKLEEPFARDIEDFQITIFMALAACCQFAFRSNSESMAHAEAG